MPETQNHSQIPETTQDRKRIGGSRLSTATGELLATKMSTLLFFTHQPGALTG
ncbi:hypothetical protein AB6813_09205 [bacterium RCC_150]